MKYILIETYPGSPKVGTEIFKNGPFWQSDFHTIGVDHFHCKEADLNPEDYPNNWAKVVE